MDLVVRVSNALSSSLSPVPGKKALPLAFGLNEVKLLSSKVEAVLKGFRYLLISQLRNFHRR